MNPKIWLVEWCPGMSGQADVAVGDRPDLGVPRKVVVSISSAKKVIGPGAGE